MELLPIGSIVTVKDGTRKLMITGRMQYDQENNTLNDYLACLYPEGIIGDEYHFLFNHDEIQEVVYIGYESEEDREHLETLEGLIEEAKIKIKEDICDK